MPKELSEFTADDILDAWVTALKEGAGSSVTVQGIEPDGLVARELRNRISGRLETTPFDERALENSTKVARDLGAVCRVLGEAAEDKTVSADTFQAIVRLRSFHPACPPDTGGAGRFC
jgi:hypothetical protein